MKMLDWCQQNQNLLAFARKLIGFWIVISISMAIFFENIAKSGLSANIKQIGVICLLVFTVPALLTWLQLLLKENRFAGIFPKLGEAFEMRSQGAKFRYVLIEMAVWAITAGTAVTFLIQLSEGGDYPLAAQLTEAAVVPPLVTIVRTVEVFLSYEFLEKG